MSVEGPPRMDVLGVEWVRRSRKEVGRRYIVVKTGQEIFVVLWNMRTRIS